MVAALILIIKTIGSLYILAILLRFLLQAARADFYNPVTQAIVKVTTPALFPFRKIIPGYRGYDFAALVLALTLSALATALMVLIYSGGLLAVGTMVSWAFLGLVNFILDIYLYSTFISIIASFVAPFSGNPALLVVYQILEPVYSRVRRVIPPMGGLDLSPIFILLGIRVIRMALVFSLAGRVGLQPGLVIGFT